MRSCRELDARDLVAPSAVRGCFRENDMITAFFETRSHGVTGQRLNDRGGARWWIGAVYAVLLALVVPWYWPAGDTRHLYGLPLWAIATLLAVVATSAFTAWTYLSRTAGADENAQPQRDGDAGSRGQR